jgi:hypothetical protein
MKLTTWLVPVLILGSIGVGLGMWARSAVAIQRGRAWGLTREVALRIQSDEGARRLFAANPELGARFGSEAAFLASIRAHREAFNVLPALEPSENYLCMPGLTSFTAQVQGRDGFWMELEVQSPSFLDEVRGEGIHLLQFTSGRAGLRHAVAAEAEAFNEALWNRYLDVLAQLETPDGARALWEQEAGLHGEFPRAEDLGAWAASHRARWAGLPRSPWGRVGHGKITRHREGTVDTASLSCRVGAWDLQMTWRGDRLVALGLLPAGTG